LDRRTNTSDGSGGASPTVVTERHDDDDLTADTDEPTQILGTSSVRTATRSTAKGASAKEASANGSSAADEKDEAAGDVPALPADSIGSTRESFGFSRSVPATVSPGAGNDWAAARRMSQPAFAGQPPVAVLPVALRGPGAGCAAEGPAADWRLNFSFWALMNSR